MRETRQKGFTLLLSMLVVSMVLSVALGITEIVIKENQLATLVRESEAAFHAADKGIDCALFYHISYDRTPLPNGTYTTILYSPFATSSATEFPNMSVSAGDEMSLVTCEDQGVNRRLDSIWSFPVARTASAATTRFRLNFGTPPNAPCVDVTVANSNNGVDSLITAEGYNTCDTNSPRRTLRVIEVTTNF